jgi:predicted PhzF superfamily epimerase YddE/YHI9
MTLSIHQVDAFADAPFRGNPAAVVLLPAHREPAHQEAAWMADVAMEMNLSETAFLVRRADGAFDLRWFTPAVEVALCGHATLASAHVLWETGALAPGELARFHTKSGLLTAARLADGRIELDFPACVAVSEPPPAGLAAALGADLLYAGRNVDDYLVEVASEAVVRGLRPTHRDLGMLGVRGVIVTARAQGGGFDFVSRFFAPGAGIDEDPVTGSAHCALAPHWGKILGKTEMVGYQASKRGGVVHVRLEGDRVKLAGKAITVLAGELRV